MSGAMSKFTGYFRGQPAVPLNTAPSHLLTDPIFTNAAQMNNEFLHHHKPLSWQQNSQGLWQTAPLQQLPLSQPSFQSRGLQRGGYRQIRLRTHNWGTRSENGWSGFNNWKYQPQNLSSWESKSYLLEELRAQSRGQRGLGAPFNQDLFFQQWQQQRFGGQQWGSLPLQKQAPFIAPFQAPLIAPQQQFVQTVMKPTIVQETLRTDRVVQVQPILHREVEQPIVNHIEKHITEAPVAQLGGVVRMAPVIQEHTNTRVINEVTPVIHRERAIAQVERVEEHVSEHIVAPTQHTKSVQYESVAPIAPLAAPLAAPIVAAPITPIAAPIVPLAATPLSAPLVNTTPITKVVPQTGYAASPLLLEKQQQAALVQPITPSYGAAMM